MARWTPAQARELAPDDRSITAANKLARPGPWSETGATDTLVWGKCQGSGKTPYQVSIDLTGPAFKCSCPSRKFPCKHGLALLFLWVEGDGAVSDAAEAADFAGDWAKDRSTKAAAKAARADAAPPDPEGQAKRLAARLELMDAGAADFELWLGDLYRGGLASARHRPYTFWEDAAARLLDAQMPGLAQRVRDAPSLLHGDDWADRVLAETGRWFLAVRAWQRRAELPEDRVANLRAFLGWSWSSADIRDGDTVTGRWMVEGLHRTDDGRLQSQRTWIRRVDDGRRALVLDFAAAGTPMTSQVAGVELDATVAFYPGTGLRRALLVDTPGRPRIADRLPDAGTIDDAYRAGAAWLAANPFLDRTPATVRGTVQAGSNGTGAMIVDDDGRHMLLESDFEPWELLAACGPGPTTVFGEITDGVFRPLTVATATAVVPL